MLNRKPAIIEDIYADDRIPHDAYRPTFVKSLIMVPIRTLDPLGAIGNYWAKPHQATAEEVRLLQALADTTAVAIENVRVIAELEDRVKARTAELEASNEQLAAANRELLAAHHQADRVFAAYAKALPGSVLDGKYRLDKELGVGGFGAVFQGRHLVLDTPIAVKVFRPVPGNDSAIDLERFLREGAAAARLNHPHAVQVMDSGVSSEGVAFLVMELLEGRTLGQELAIHGPLSLRRCARIAADVADVLAVAHRRGILHRDIKPENIFLHQSPQGEVVKVVDFGLAKFFGEHSDATPRPELTRIGEMMGTPTYIAPERMAGVSDDVRSDIFSLGAVLYKMICGKTPWSREDRMEVIAGLRKILPRPMQMFRQHVPVELERLVQTALAIDPRQRPNTDEFAAALAELVDELADEPAHADVAETDATPACAIN
jgi:serine/threonine protein kinase